MVYVLSLILLINTVAFTPASKPKQYDVGARIHGFVVDSIGYAGDLDCNVYTLTHERTRAKLFWIRADDETVAFSIGFATRPTSDNGALHVLEHCVVAGSKRYPHTTLFNEMRAKLLLSDINASTFDNCTVYPLACYDEKQLLSAADAYVDCALQPAVLTDPNIFRREGIRFNYDDDTGVIQAAGIVYNEMTHYAADPELYGAATINRVLFADTSAAYYAGGMPNDILGLKHSDVVAAHEAYYYPSNSVSTIYGDVDVGKFCAMLDKAFKSHEYREPVESLSLPTLEQPVTKHVKYASKNGDSYVTQSYRIDASADELPAVLLTASLLQRDDAPLLQALDASRLADEYRVSLDVGAPSPVLTVTAVGIPSQRYRDFTALLQETLLGMSRRIDADLLEALLYKERFRAATKTLASGAGFNAVTYAPHYYYATGGISYIADESGALSALADQVGEKLIERTIEKHLINNKRRVVVTMSPDGTLPTIPECSARILSDALRGLEQEDFDKIVEADTEYKLWQAEDVSDKAISRIRVSSPSREDCIPQPVSLRKSEINGQRLYAAPLPTRGISYVQLLYDISHVPPERLHALQLYLRMMGSVDTTERGYDDLKKQTARYIGDIRCDVTWVTTDYLTNAGYPAVNLTVGADNAYIREAVALATEMLYASSPDAVDVDTRAHDELSRYKNRLTSNPLGEAVGIAAGSVSPACGYRSYANGYGYYEYLQRLCVQDTPDASETDGIGALLHNAPRVTATIFGDGDALSYAFFPTYDAIMRLPLPTPTPTRYAIPRPANRTALLTDGGVSHNVAAVTLPTELVTDGKIYVINNILNNTYLLPKLRLQAGAYGAGMLLMDRKMPYAMVMYTLSDPNVYDTMDAFAQIPAFMSAYKLSRDEAQGYITATLRVMRENGGALSAAMGAVSRDIAGMTQQTLLRRVDDIRRFAPRDLARYADTYASMLGDASLCTALSRDRAEEYGAAYEVILE